MKLFENFGQFHVVLIFLSLGIAFEIVRYVLCKLGKKVAKSKSFDEVLTASLYFLVGIPLIFLAIALPTAKIGIYVPLAFFVGNYISNELLKKVIAK